jgi:cleavage and polyadenylation specificity factor subunit 1
LDIQTSHAEAQHQHQQQSNANIVQYQFEICDILLNIGPCGHSIVADSMNNELAHNYDLVTSSGYSKNGAVSVLQRSIRPDVLTTFELADIVDMWSVFACDSASDDTTFLFLSNFKNPEPVFGERED